MEDAARDPLDHLITALDRLAPQGRLGIAVSGGGDSMALLAMAQIWAERADREIAAVTVDHRLRDQSTAEAKAVANYCAAASISHTTLTTPPLGTRGNLSAEARDARYALMSEWAEALNIGAIALGHTMDDQAETVLMRLGRGSGVDGLSAMAPQRHWLGIDWLRPLLGIRRDALRAWLRARNIDWIEDPTNEDTRYDRVKARQALAVLAPLGVDPKGLADTAARLGSQREALDRLTTSFLARSVAWGNFGEASLDVAAFGAQDLEIARRAMARLLRVVSARDYPPRHRVLAQVLQDIHNPTFKSATLGGCLVQADGTRRLICREPAAVDNQEAAWTGSHTWDRRWALFGPDMPDLSLAALGADGLVHLNAAAQEGWIPPDAWRSAPKSVRLGLPALWLKTCEDVRKLAAVPPIHYLDPDIEGIEGPWSARLIMRHDASFR